MKNLFEQSRSHWVRYDRYEIKTGKDCSGEIMWRLSTLSSGVK